MSQPLFMTKQRFSKASIDKPHKKRAISYLTARFFIFLLGE